MALVFMLVLQIATALWCQRPPVKEAYVGEDKRVHIIMASGRDDKMPPDIGQDGAEDVQVANDGRTVGWLVDLRASCCVSYSIPVRMVLWRDGGIIRRIDSNQAIFGWTFLKSGKEVAFHTAPLHGSEIYDCTRVDVATGKTLEEWWMRKTPKPPEWVDLLDKQYPMPDPDNLPPQP